ncbi:hypothetical protein AAKU55_003376 [Oxalobacteraceae bacterium GrIS 1.11]
MRDDGIEIDDVRKEIRKAGAETAVPNSALKRSQSVDLICRIK